MHITRCQSPGRREMFKLSVRSLTTWMTDTGAHVMLIDMVEEYLLAQDTKQIVDCLHVDNASYRLLAESTDRLRWDSFLEGHISTVWLEVMKPQLQAGNTYLSPQRWGRQFIEQLLQNTHKQWIFRNSRLHYKKLDGLTELEHHKIFEKMKGLMHTDPDDLLPVIGTFWRKFWCSWGRIFC